MICHSIEKEVNGIYNAVSQSDSQIELTKKIAKHYKRPVFLPAVPGFVLKLLLGEGSSLVLNGYPASNEKIKATGFEFKYLNPND
jgi:NAD dependent epimerase/dehydratase family enzyme